MTSAEVVKQTRDIRGLIRMLDHDNHNVQWRAADALGTRGEEACNPLIRILDFPKVHVRIGAIEALGDIRCPRSVDPLIRKLKSDPDNEVRWVAALALGQIKDSRVVPALIEALQDHDRYVRHGAVKALELQNWTPGTDTERAYALIALQDWKALQVLGRAATAPLAKIMSDPNPVTRSKIVEVLGSINDPAAITTCESALMDRDSGVRWAATLACKRYGVATRRISLILSRHPKTNPSALGAAVLNLFFFGQGYSYIGKWWGGLVSMSYTCIMVLIQLNWDLTFPYIYFYPLTALCAIQTYYAVRRMPVT